MSLSLPDNLPGVPTAVELWDRVKSGSLWITRAGSCRFELDISLEELGDHSPRADFQHRNRMTVMEAFQAFPAWDALGLDLRPEVNVFKGKRDAHEAFVYSVQHTRQQSALFTPPGVACGYLSAVSSSFRFGNRKTCTTRKPRTDSRIVTLKVPPHDLQRIAGRLNQSFEFRKLSPDLQAERLKHLAHSALNLLVGLKKRPSGARLLKPFKPPALLNLAPAVWNAVFFQNAFARAQLVTSISSTLGNVASTQSPVLRQKVEDLVRGPGPDSRLQDMSEELHKRTIALLLRAAHVQMTKGRGPSATRQPRTQADKLTQNDQIVAFDGSQLSQSVATMHDTPQDHDIPPYPRLYDAGGAPASEYLQEYRLPDDGVFGDFDEDLGRSETDDVQEFEPLGWMRDFRHIHGEDSHEGYHRQSNFGPDEMDHAALSEDMALCTPTEHAEGLRREYSDPDFMDDEEELMEDGEYYIAVGEEEHLQHQISLNDIHNADLAANTYLFAARDHDGYDEEMSSFEEDRPTSRWTYEDDFDDDYEADGVFDHATFQPENANNYSYHLRDQEQIEGDLDQGPGKTRTYYAQGHTQEELHDQVMHSMSGVGFEQPGVRCGREIEYFHDDDREYGVYTPQYTHAHDIDHAEEVEAEGTAAYFHSEPYPHGWDQVPRTYPHPHGVHWTRSMGGAQDSVKARPSFSGAPEFGAIREHLIETVYGEDDEGSFL